MAGGMSFGRYGKKMSIRVKLLLATPKMVLKSKSKGQVSKMPRCANAFLTATAVSCLRLCKSAAYHPISAPVTTSHVALLLYKSCRTSVCA